jgi:peptidoglycan/LPS O-acetylase OafA/YrhL
MVPLRGHALTYLAGGPAIAALTGLLLTLVLAWLSTRFVEEPVLRHFRPVPARAGA